MYLKEKTQFVVNSIRNFKNLGMNMIIHTYVWYHGYYEMWLRCILKKWSILYLQIVGVFQFKVQIMLYSKTTSIWLDDTIYMKDKRVKEQPEHNWQLRSNYGVFSKALRVIKLLWIYNIKTEQ